MAVDRTLAGPTQDGLLDVIGVCRWLVQFPAVSQLKFRQTLTSSSSPKSEPSHNHGKAFPVSEFKHCGLTPYTTLEKRQRVRFSCGNFAIAKTAICPASFVEAVVDVS